MEVYIPLEPTCEGTRYLANKTLRSYVQLDGIENKNAIDCVHQFLCVYGIWRENDEVILTGFKSNRPQAPWYDLTPILNIYNQAYHESQKRRREHDEYQLYNDSMELTGPQQTMTPLIVKRLDNPNINHQEKSHKSIPNNVETFVPPQKNDVVQNNHNSKNNVTKNQEAQTLEESENDELEHLLNKVNIKEKQTVNDKKVVKSNNTKQQKPVKADYRKELVQKLMSEQEEDSDIPDKFSDNSTADEIVDEDSTDEKDNSENAVEELSEEDDISENTSADDIPTSTPEIQQIKSKKITPIKKTVPTSKPIITSKKETPNTLKGEKRKVVRPDTSPKKNYKKTTGGSKSAKVRGGSKTTKSKIVPSKNTIKNSRGNKGKK